MKTHYLLSQLLTVKQHEITTEKPLRFQTGLQVSMIHLMSGMTRILFHEDPTTFQIMEHRNEIFIAKKDFKLM